MNDKKVEMVELPSGTLVVADLGLLTSLGYRPGIVSSFQIPTKEGISEISLTATKGLDHYHTRVNMRSSGTLVVGDLLRASTSWFEPLQDYYVQNRTTTDGKTDIHVLLGMKCGTYMVTQTMSDDHSDNYA